MHTQSHIKNTILFVDLCSYTLFFFFFSVDLPKDEIAGGLSHSAWSTLPRLSLENPRNHTRPNVYTIVLRHPLNGSRPLILQRVTKNFLFSLPGELEKDNITIVTPQAKNTPKSFNVVLRDTGRDNTGTSGSSSSGGNSANKYPSVSFQILCEQTLLLRFVITFGSEYDKTR